MARKYIDGEVMDLTWEDGPESLYVRGHMTPEAARATLEGFYDGAYTFADPEPVYGRWSAETTWDGPMQVLREHDAPGRGCFRMMRAEVIR